VPDLLADFSLDRDGAALRRKIPPPAAAANNP
jgi:hypothetical protein